MRLPTIFIGCILLSISGEAFSSENSDSFRYHKSEFLNVHGGFGVNTFLIVPVPFVELGLDFGIFSITGNLGSNLVAYTRYYGEVSLNGSRYSFFINQGTAAVVQGTSLQEVTGLGVELKSSDKHKYYRAEIVRYTSKNKKYGGRAYIPHFSIGYRYFAL